MRGMLRHVRVLAALAVALIAGVPGVATAQEAVLYEIVENLDTVQLANNQRTSYWTAQGTAQAGSPFCPPALLPPRVKSCTITAFGTDTIDFVALMTGAPTVGTVWANVVAVANTLGGVDIDNEIDAPEIATFSGQITGQLAIVPPGGAAPVMPVLGKKRSLLGPALPLIYIVNGKFFPDAVPTVRTSPPSPLPVIGATATFESTFRLPFAVAKNGKFAKAERGKPAYYLGDNGRLIRVDRESEYALGFPLLRGEVFFD
jgi:hypothetical protein